MSSRFFMRSDGAVPTLVAKAYSSPVSSSRSWEQRDSDLTSVLSFVSVSTRRCTSLSPWLPCALTAPSHSTTIPTARTSEILKNLSRRAIVEPTQNVTAPNLRDERQRGLAIEHPERGAYRLAPLFSIAPAPNHARSVAGALHSCQGFVTPKKRGADGLDPNPPTPPGQDRQSLQAPPVRKRCSGPCSRIRSQHQGWRLADKDQRATQSLLSTTLYTLYTV